MGKNKKKNQRGFKCFIVLFFVWGDYTCKFWFGGNYIQKIISYYIVENQFAVLYAAVQELILFFVSEGVYY